MASTCATRDRERARDKRHLRGEPDKTRTHSTSGPPSPATTAHLCSGWRRFGAIAVALLALLLADGVSAHEQRDVGGGRYSLTVGFINEPPYVGLENGLYLDVVSLTGEQGPVEGLAGALTAEVIFGDRTLALELLPVAGEPGVYEARFVPTAAGDYTFRLAGQIGDQVIDETFRSSPDTFDAVQPATGVQFPEAVPAGADLAERLAMAQDDADGARALASIGIVVGVVGILCGLAALGLALRRPR